MRPFRRQVIIGATVLGAGLFGLGSSALLSPYAAPRPLPAGGLEVADPHARSAFTASVGPFEVVLSGTEGLQITEAGRPVWCARHGFLVAARGRLDWAESQGHFTFTQHLQQSYTRTLVDQVETTGDQVQMRGRLVAGRDRHSPAPVWQLILSATEAPSPRLGVELSVPGVDLVGLRADFLDTSGFSGLERVHGLGTQFAPFDLRGHHVVLATREQGVGRGREPLTTLAEWTQGAGGDHYSTYAPMPSLVTSGLRGLEWHQDEVAAVDLRERFEVTVWSERLRATWRTATAPRPLVATELPQLPEWTGTGAIVGLQGGTETVRAKLAALETPGPHNREPAPIAGVWLQDWVGRRTTDFGDRLWWTWQLDRPHYPGWDRLVGELGERGIRVLTYINPFLVDPTGKPEPVEHDLYAQAVREGFVVRNRAGEPYLLHQGGFDAALVDLTNPRAYDWLAEVVAAQPATGGWMADFAESLPFDAVLHDGDPQQFHNRWPALWHRLNAEVRGADDLVFHRSAWRGASNPMWAGDQLTTFDEHDGMASALRGILAAGVSGLPVHHTDIGGYTGLPQPVVGVHRTPELLQRWAEWSAWTPLFRTHEGNRPAESTQAYDVEAVAGFAHQARVFAALADYRTSVLAQEVTPMRHGWLEAPGTLAAERDDQYFYGSAFLVAPVFVSGARHRRVALPPGRWRLVWTGQEYEGGRLVTVPAPLGATPVLHRAEDARAGRIAAQLRRL